MALAGARLMRPEDEKARRRAIAAGVPTPGGVPDLGALKGGPLMAELVGELADEAVRQAEVQSGMRCQGCGERIERGWEFVRFRVFADNGEGKPEVRKQMTYACMGRNDCDYAAVAGQHSSAMRPVQWAFLDEGPGKAAMDATVAAANGNGGAPAEEPPA